MARLIDADALPVSKEYLVDEAGFGASFYVVHKSDIDNAPTVDAVEVKHGEWILLDECANEGVYCSVCHKKVYRANYANQEIKSKYCPNCGAKMDGERNYNEGENK